MKGQVMTKFMVLYYSKTPAQERMDQASKEQMKASMAEWMAWKDRHGDALVDFGSPLRPVTQLEDGKVEDTRTWITGFSIVQAEDKEAVVELLKDHPNFDEEAGIGMQVMEYLPMPGM